MSSPSSPDLTLRALSTLRSLTPHTRSTTDTPFNFPHPIAASFNIPSPTHPLQSSASLHTSQTEHLRLVTTMNLFQHEAGDISDESEGRTPSDDESPKKASRTTKKRAPAGSAKKASTSTAFVAVDDDDDATEKGRKKIKIEFIQEKSKRHITFSKRKAGIMKKVSRYSGQCR